VSTTDVFFVDCNSEYKNISARRLEGGDMSLIKKPILFID